MNTKAWLIGSCVIAAGALGFWVARATAAGAPMAGGMTYSGTLTDASGTPLTGKQTIGLQLWDDMSAGTSQCSVGPADVSLVAGTFSLALPDACAGAIHAHSDLWAQLTVGDVSLGRTKLGAVPYALEADTASHAAGSLADQLTAAVGKEPFAGTFPAVLGLASGGITGVCGAPPALLDLSATPMFLDAGSTFSNAFGSVIFTNAGRLAVRMTNFFVTPDPCTNGLSCAPPVTFFLKSPSRQLLSLQAYLDDTGAIYLNGAPVAMNLALTQTTNVMVDAGAFALTLMACSNNGPSFGVNVFNSFIADYGLTVDYDRVFHRNRQ
jgi:hypothetical protein